MASLRKPSCILEHLVVKGLGTSSADSNISNKHQHTTELPWDDTVEAYGDFSSFPSLSLQLSGEMSEAFEGIERGQIESRVTSLLGRPLLVHSNISVCSSNTHQADHDEADPVSTGNSDDEGSDFAGTDIVNVSAVMQKNLILSLSTLVQSRLRAYSSFLDRHGQSLAQSQSLEEHEESVVALEQKLETMLEIGNLIALGHAQLSFVPNEPCTENISGSGEDEMEVSLALSMKASTQFLVPRLKGEADPVWIEIDVPGAIVGVFNTSTSDRPLLRVVQLDLDLNYLLDQMKEAAAKVVSHIIDNTNNGYGPTIQQPLFELSLVLPPAQSIESNRKGHQKGEKRPCPFQGKGSTMSPDMVTNNDVQAVISPDAQSTMLMQSPPYGADLSHQETSDVAELSADKCGQIVDYLFHEMDLKMLFSRPEKQARLSPSVNEMNLKSQCH